ncbi:class I SAM-dependent methyltransferase [Kushneria aurantia]|uniref:Methyltransferase domain-containing protein n=1 Tax=Kushneria aurantia TaxID=504092 RepID=A0ABV6FYK5_9GAMM|nr:class I SAM-dependent methyltransferase [Kushneria aurantia]
MSDQDQAPHSDFSGEWLALREAADHDARDRHPLLKRLAPWLKARDDSVQIVDLGCGSGSNLRYLSARLTSEQQWWLLDQDAALLDSAANTSHAAQVSALTTRRCDLVALEEALARHAPPHPDLVTASALLDLVAESWLTTLADWCGERRCALLLALSIDGDNRLAERTGSDDAMRALDRDVQQLIARHQRRDKGFNGALGCDAPVVAQRLLNERGFEVSVATAPWQLDSRRPNHAELMHALVAGWYDAALEQAPIRREALDHWYSRRCAAIKDGTLDIEVGHQDLLALPQGDRRQ